MTITDEQIKAVAARMVILRGYREGEAEARHFYEVAAQEIRDVMGGDDK